MERDGQVAPCRNLLQFRTCRFGAHCRYSHDPIYSQRRPPPARTPCFHWEEKGTCPYGTKCAYKHDDRNRLASLRDGLLEEMASFARPQDTHHEPAELKPDIACLASYAWLDTEHPTIAMPGDPPILSEPNYPMRLQPDSIAFPRTVEDEKSNEPYAHRLESLARACLHASRIDPFHDAHFVGGLNNLRQLLHFAFGASKTSFRIDVERCRETILTTRWEPNPAWLMKTSPCRGYGRGFEEAVTKSSAERVPTTSHHRVVSNIVGETHLIVQYQVDACACKCGRATSGHEDMVSIDEIVASRKGQETPGADGALRVVDAGTPHSPACLVEIKSRDVKNTDTDDIMAQLWLSGQANLYLARHIRGLFSRGAIEHRAFDVEIEEWQRRNSGKIHGFLMLLQNVRSTICDRSRASAEEKYALLYEPGVSGDRLVLMRRQNGLGFMRDETKQALSLTE